MRPVLPLALMSLLAGCGYVGEPLPPALRIPESVKDLAAAERGDNLVVEFTLPERTTEGLLVRETGEIELRAGSLGGRAWNRDEWLAVSKRIGVPAPAGARVRVEIPARAWAGQEVVFGVRTANPRGRFSDWSNLFVLHVVPPLAAPAGLEARAVPEGVRVSWRGVQEPAGVVFRVLRKAPGQQEAAEAARVPGSEWIDRETEYGKSYEYRVEAVVKSGDREASSEPAGPVAVTPVDVFPPAPPAGLTAIAGINTVELAWDRNTEPDLRGYRLYRAAGDRAFEKIADLVEAPSYSDRAVKSGERYRYAVSALDQAGNQSARSPAAEIVAP